MAKHYCVAGRYDGWDDDEYWGYEADGPADAISKFLVQVKAEVEDEGGEFDEDYAYIHAVLESYLPIKKVMG